MTTGSPHDAARAGVTAWVADTVRFGRGHGPADIRWVSRGSFD